MIYCSAKVWHHKPSQENCWHDPGKHSSSPAALEWDHTGSWFRKVVDFILSERGANGPLWSLGAHASFPSDLCRAGCAL